MRRPTPIFPTRRRCRPTSNCSWTRRDLQPVPLRKETQAFIAAGFVDPRNLLFASAHVTRVREVAPALHEDVNALDAAYAAVHRDHPFHTPPALAAAIRRLLEQPEFGSILDPGRQQTAREES